MGTEGIGKRGVRGRREDERRKECTVSCYLLQKDGIDALRFTACFSLPSNSLCIFLDPSVELCDAGEVESCSE